jgi:hypothetical protein
VAGERRPGDPAGAADGARLIKVPVSNWRWLRTQRQDLGPLERGLPAID